MMSAIKFDKIKTLSEYIVSYFNSTRIVSTL